MAYLVTSYEWRCRRRSGVVRHGNHEACALTHTHTCKSSTAVDTHIHMQRERAPVNSLFNMRRGTLPRLALPGFALALPPEVGRV